MNKQIALICLAKLNGAVYLDRTSGIVQVVKKTEILEDAQMKITKNIPYTSFATYEQCGKPEFQMIPNSKFKSCLYFEDNGIQPRGRAGKKSVFTSRLRLVCWLNTARIAGQASPLLAGLIMADIIKRLTESTNFNSSPFVAITISLTGVPVQDANIFNNYDYRNEDKPFLMMPYDFFALDLGINFSVPDSCLDELTALDFEPCPPSDAILTEAGGLVKDDKGNYVKQD